MKRKTKPKYEVSVLTPGDDPFVIAGLSCEVVALRSALLNCEDVMHLVEQVVDLVHHSEITVVEELPSGDRRTVFAGDGERLLVASYLLEGGPTP